MTFRMTGSQAEAEELAQAAILRAHQQLSSFTGGGKFSPWLGKIASHLSLDWPGRENRGDSIHSKWAADIFSENNPGSGVADALARWVQAGGNHLKIETRNPVPAAM